MDNGLVSADYICPVCRPFGMDGVEYGKILAAGMDGPTGLSSAKSADEMKEPNNEPQNQDKSSNVALRSRTSSKFSNIGNTLHCRDIFNLYLKYQVACKQQHNQRWFRPITKTNKPE